VGYERGHADGFERALNLPAQHMPALRMWGQDQSWECMYARSRNEEVEQVHAAMEQSRHTFDYESRGPSSSGAGPSHNHQSSRRASPGPAQPRQASPGPLPTKQKAHRASETFQEVIITSSDTSSVKYKGLAQIPLPPHEVAGVPKTASLVFRVPHPLPPPESASSYLEHWAGFAAGCTLPNCFLQLFQVFGTQLDHHYVMSAVLGYGLSHRIIAANPSLDRNVINAFLIVLAACHQYRPLLSGLWSAVLTSATDQAIDNWAAVWLYTRHLPALKPATNTAFHMPPSVHKGLEVPLVCTTEAWHIHTTWSVNDFLRFLMVVRPSLEYLRALLNFADVFIQTWQAGGLVSGYSPVARLARDQMFMASFLTAETCPFAFSEGPRLARMSEEGKDDDKDESQMDVDAGLSSKN
jgi:hypothetical protein